MAGVTHTPGPWSAHTSPPADAASVWADAEDNLSVAAPIAICTDHDLGRRSVEECQANARLIAAAPDMLSALKAIISCADDYKVYAAGGVMGAAVASMTELRKRSDEGMASARAVIAKVEGL